MGIPAYMSYILKNYANIIQSIESHKKNKTKFDCLYMDCNSIIYDVFNLLEKIDYENIEEFIILKVIEKIEYYILTIAPTDILYIAFDGVAPFSKMEQQRVRRYKTWHTSTFIFNEQLNNKTDEMNKTNKTNKMNWSTSSITPGTLFMNNLSKKIKQQFESLEKEKKYGINKIIVSGSDEVGEGEQKIFKYFRHHEEEHIEKNILVYGLDSDLIMLSIFHCNRCNNIFVFREEIEFKLSKNKKTINNVENIDNKNKNLMFLDIQRLSESILFEMTGKSFGNVSKKIGLDNYLSEGVQRVYDYLFLCFFLGNDFLPHYPSLNIRTNGIMLLLDTYKQVIGKYHDRGFISSYGKIQWKWLKKFIETLAKNEKQMFLSEYEVREKMDNYKWQQTTNEEKEYVLHNTPIILRTEEKYICPTENMWEERYYKILFDKERTSDNIKKISINFLEGLEWVFKYYTNDCPDWKWKYHYHYPPLFVDLMKYIPDCEKDYIGFYKTIPFTPSLQLSYVLPEKNHFLLGEKKKEFLKKNYPCLFPKEMIYKWAFCRYFFESHILLPEISIEILEKLEREIILL